MNAPDTRLNFRAFVREELVIEPSVQRYEVMRPYVEPKAWSDVRKLAFAQSWRNPRFPSLYP